MTNDYKAAARALAKHLDASIPLFEQPPNTVTPKQYAELMGLSRSQSQNILKIAAEAGKIKRLEYRATSGLRKVAYAIGK